jgi:isopenicillin N synthase-like dioxygenase
MAIERAGEIPIIDIGAIHTEPSEVAAPKIAEAIRAACRDTGFFYIANHGIPDDLVRGVFDANRDFHARPDEEKLPLKLNAWHRGYQPMASTRMLSSARFEPAPAPNQLESFIIRDEVPETDPGYMARPFLGPNQWPDDAPFRNKVESYHAAARQLAIDLLPAFSVAVGEELDFFRQFFDPPASTLRMVHYPPSPVKRDADWLGIYPHTDYGFITVLAQDDVGGLEIMRVDGSWIEAPYVEGTFVVNIGDAMARWSNAVFNSSPHRVINKSTEQDRYSVALFFDPNHGSEIRCIDKFAREAGGAKFPPIRFADYYQERMDTNHPDRRAAS